MNRKTLGIIFLLLGAVLIVGGIAGIVSGFKGMLNNMKPLATLEAPGQLELSLPDSDTFTIWHDYQTTHNGTIVGHPKKLPAGYAFSLVSENGNAIPFTPLRISQTLSTGSRHAVGVGTFVTTTGGTHTLKVDNTDGSTRIISISEGDFTAKIARAGGRIVIFGILAGLGVTLAVIGIILLLIKRKRTPQTPPPLT